MTYKYKRPIDWGFVSLCAAFTCAGLSIPFIIIAGGNAADKIQNHYEQSCKERNGTAVYNGKHYECFINSKE
jgi:hypothetical protein